MGAGFLWGAMITPETPSDERYEEAAAMTDLDKLHAEGMALLEAHRRALDAGALRMVCPDTAAALARWLRDHGIDLLEGIAAMRRKPGAVADSRPTV